MRVVALEEHFTVPALVRRDDRRRGSATAPPPPCKAIIKLVID